jgi:hypothetical protein
LVIGIHCCASGRDVGPVAAACIACQISPCTKSSGPFQASCRMRVQKSAKRSCPCVSSSAHEPLGHQALGRCAPPFWWGGLVLASFSSFAVRRREGGSVCRPGPWFFGKPGPSGGGFSFALPVFVGFFVPRPVFGPVPCVLCALQGISTISNVGLTSKLLFECLGISACLFSLIGM